LFLKQIGEILGSKIYSHIFYKLTVAKAWEAQRDDEEGRRCTIRSQIYLERNSSQ
jgi:hypothetical protein